MPFREQSSATHRRSQSSIPLHTASYHFVSGKTYEQRAPVGCESYEHPNTGRRNRSGGNWVFRSSRRTNSQPTEKVVRPSIAEDVIVAVAAEYDIRTWDDFVTDLHVKSQGDKVVLYGVDESDINTVHIDAINTTILFIDEPVGGTITFFGEGEEDVLAAISFAPVSDYHLA
jgi:hypothetical protein